MALIIELMVLFALLSLVASFINGAMGYGYSSISTPLALLVLVNKIVNPAYVLLEAMANTVMAVVSGKKNFKATFRRTLPIIIPLVPGAIIGSLILAGLATWAPSWAKFVVYATILPLVLLQAAGIRKTIKRETHAGIPLGFGIGLIYSITTISGPPIALFLSNQGLERDEFKAAISQIRIAESYITCIAYYFLGLFGANSVGWFGAVSPLQLFEILAPPVVIGLPLGMMVAKHLDMEAFKRVGMSFNAWIVGYGLDRVLVTFFNVNVNIANLIYAGIVGLSVVILYRFLAKKSGTAIEKIPVSSQGSLSRDPPLRQDNSGQKSSQDFTKQQTAGSS